MTALPLLLAVAFVAIAALLIINVLQRRTYRAVEADRRAADLDRRAADQALGEAHLALAELSASPLVGKLVIVNTPMPDDQSFRGVVTRDDFNDGDGLVLTAAVRLATVQGDEGLELIEEPTGDLILPRYASAIPVDDTAT